MDHKEAFIRMGVYLRGWSPHTVRTYRQALAAFGDTEATKASLDRWIISLRQRNLTPGGINMYARTVNSYLSWLHEEGYVDTKLRVRLLADPKRPPEIPTGAEMGRLIRWKPDTSFQLRTKTLVVVLADTGLRISEALSLVWKDVDLDALQLTVRGKGGRWRYVPFSYASRKALWKLQDALETTFVFQAESGHPLAYRNAYRDIKHVCGLAGFSGEHVHPHAFRHFFAVGYLRNGGDIYRLGRILGHTSLSTTQLYLRSLGIEALQEAHSQFSPLARL